MTSFIEADLNEHFKDCNQKETLNKYLSKIENGIVLPIAKHGSYKENWAIELYYTRKSGNYNILSLAHELFFLEQNTIIY